MAQKEVSSEYDLQTNYSELNKSCNSHDYDKVVRFSDKILKKYPNEFKAFHCKIIAYMQMNNFEQALKFLTSNDFQTELLFEKAYCEYRLNNLDQAVNTIKLAPESDLRMQELQAQILYKQEEYEASLKKYKHLIRNINDSYEDERSVNMVANVAAMMQWQKEKREFPKVPESTFEVSLNKACYLSADGQYEMAIAKLKEAEDTCLQAFEGDDEVTQTEIDEEICSIKVQRAYCLQKMNKIQEASAIYHDVLKKRCGESHVLAVAANNVVCINRDQNLFDSRKKIKMASADQQLRLTRQQQLTVAGNQLLFLFYSNQAEQVKSQATTLLVQLCASDLVAPAPLLKVLLIKAAQLVKEKHVPAALALLEDQLDQAADWPEMGDEGRGCLLRLRLAVAQLHLSQNSVSRCQETLAGLPAPELHRLGVMGTRVALLLLLEDREAATGCMEEALQFWQTTKPEQHARLLPLAAGLCSKLGMHREAALFYRQLLAMRPSDQAVLASLIAAYSRFDKDLAEKTSLQLKEDNLLPEVDVDSLESAFIFGTKAMKKLLKGGSEATPVSEVVGRPRAKQTTSATKKKHKVRLPKNMEPGKMPDPERWLPKRERSYFKGRKRDKRANMMRGPQGAVSNVPDLDASKKSSVPVTPSAEPVKTSGANNPGSASGGAQKGRGGNSGSNGNKKKNKGKKR